MAAQSPTFEISVDTSKDFFCTYLFNSHFSSPLRCHRQCTFWRWVFLRGLKVFCLQTQKQWKPEWVAFALHFNAIMLSYLKWQNIFSFDKRSLEFWKNCENVSRWRMKAIFFSRIKQRKTFRLTYTKQQSKHEERESDKVFVDTLINKTFNYRRECFKHFPKLLLGDSAESFQRQRNDLSKKARKKEIFPLHFA